MKNESNKKMFFLFSIIAVLMFSVTAYCETNFQDMAPGSELEEPKHI